jgi:hypothetical protein
MIQWKKLLLLVVDISAFMRIFLYKLLLKKQTEDPDMGPY